MEHPNSLDLDAYESEDDFVGIRNSLFFSIVFWTLLYFILHYFG